MVGPPRARLSTLARPSSSARRLPPSAPGGADRCASRSPALLAMGAGQGGVGARSSLCRAACARGSRSAAPNGRRQTNRRLSPALPGIRSVIRAHGAPSAGAASPVPRTDRPGAPRPTRYASRPNPMGAGQEASGVGRGASGRRPQSGLSGANRTSATSSAPRPTCTGPSAFAAHGCVNRVLTVSRRPPPATAVLHHILSMGPRFCSACFMRNSSSVVPAGKADAAALLLDDPLRDRQPEPAAVHARPLVPAAVEPVEYVSEVVTGNDLSLIAHPSHHLLALCLQLDVHRRARMGVLDGVVASQSAVTGRGSVLPSHRSWRSTPPAPRQRPRSSARG